MQCPNCGHNFTLAGCDSVDPETGAKSGQPLGHKTRCGNGLRSWNYNKPPEPESPRAFTSGFVQEVER